MKVFLVVGMHRSATSLVAKGLHESGVHMGDNMIGPMSSNPEGHFEDRRAVLANDRILRKAGGGWRNPPLHESIVEVDDDGLRSYVATRSEHPLWGVKDPRLSLTWPVWLPLLEDVDLHVVWVRRSRLEVARSLVRRDGGDLGGWMDLAAVYEERVAALMEAAYA